MRRVSIQMAAISLIAVAFAGCSRDSKMMSGSEAPMVQTVPADGESSYDPSAPIFLKFSESVDTGGFHGSFFCMEDTAHRTLNDSMPGGMMGNGDSHGHMDRGGMGGMMQGMMGDSSAAGCARMHSGMMGNSDSTGRMNQGGMGGMMSDSMMGRGNKVCSDSMLLRQMHSRRVPGQVMWNADGDSCVFVPASGLRRNQDYVMMFRSDMKTRRGGRMRHQGGILFQDMIIHFHTR